MAYYRIILMIKKENKRDWRVIRTTLQANKYNLFSITGLKYHKDPR